MSDDIDWDEVREDDRRLDRWDDGEDEQEPRLTRIRLHSLAGRAAALLAAMEEGK